MNLEAEISVMVGALLVDDHAPVCRPAASR